MFLNLLSKIITSHKIQWFNIANNSTPTTSFCALFETTNESTVWSEQQQQKTFIDNISSKVK